MKTFTGNLRETFWVKKKTFSGDFRETNASFLVAVSLAFRGRSKTLTVIPNLVPRVFSLSNMAAAGETLAHSTNHVTDLSTESGNLFKMAAKIKTERIWVRGLETEEKQTKWRQRQNSKEAKNMKEYTYKPQEYGRMI